LDWINKYINACTWSLHTVTFCIILSNVADLKKFNEHKLQQSSNKSIPNAMHNYYFSLGACDKHMQNLYRKNTFAGINIGAIYKL